MTIQFCFSQADWQLLEGTYFISLLINLYVKCFSRYILLFIHQKNISSGISLILFDHNKTILGLWTETNWLSALSNVHVWKSKTNSAIKTSYLMDRDFIRKDLQQYLSFQKWVIKNYLHGCSSCRKSHKNFHTDSQNTGNRENRLLNWIHYKNNVHVISTINQ